MSVITVCFNAAETILDTLQSVARQTYPDIEHIVVDGGSTDGTVELVRGYSAKVAKLISEHDDGIYYAMNKGIELSTGDVIGFLNSDDFFASEDSVASIVNALSNPEIDVVHGDLVYVRRDDPNQVVRYWRASPFVPGAFARGWSPAHPTFYVKRRALLQTGKFDTSFRVAADIDLMLRTLEIWRARSTVIPQILIKMRAGGVSNSSLAGIFRQNREVIRSIRAHGLFISIPIFTVKKIFIRALQLFFATPVGRRVALVIQSEEALP